MLIKLIENLYFYNTLGGFYILIAMINLFAGGYILRSIGYVFALPTLFLGAALVVSANAVRITREKLYRSFFPVILFYLWVFFTSAVTGAINYDVAREMAIYCFFWSVIPYGCGLLLSARLRDISDKFIMVFFFILLAMSVASAGTNWNEIWYGRYRVTAYSEISENSFGVILGVYAIVAVVRMYNSRIFYAVKIPVILCVAIISALVVLLSGSMGGAISLYLTLIFLIWASRGVLKHSLFSIKKMVFLFGTIIVTTLLLYSLMGYSQSSTIQYGTGIENVGKYMERINNIANRRFDQVESIRSFHISLFLDQFFESPIIGKGFGSRPGLRNDPHNYFIELLGETGIVSVILYLVIIFYPLRSALRILGNKKERGVLFLLAVMTLALFFETFFSGSIFIDPQFWFLIGIMPLCTDGVRGSNFCEKPSNIGTGGIPLSVR